MVNDSSLGGTPQFVFDIDTQKGVMSLLASVRASELTPEQKNELRDLAFLYINGGKDQSVRITLQQKVLAYGLQPLQPITPPAPVQPPSPFGTSRPAPSFSFAASAAPVAQSVPTAVSQPTPSVVVDLAPQPASAVQSSPSPEPQPVPEPAPVPPPVSEPTPEPVSVPSPSESVPEVVLPPAAAEPVAAVVPPPQPIPTPSAESSVATLPTAEISSQPAPTPVPEPAPVSAASYDPAVSMQRIREIKSLVNEKVGNPVNLVDIDNAVGREYMAALLDAMKKLNSGTSVISAMKRLEDSFKAVEKTLEAHQSGVSVSTQSAPVPPPAPAPEPQPVPEPTPVPPPASVPEPIPEPQPAFVAPSEPVSPAPGEEPVAVAEQPAFEPVSDIPAPEPQPVPEPTTVSSPSTEPTALPVLEPVSVPTSEPESVPVPEPTPVTPVESLPSEEETVNPWQHPEDIVSVRENISSEVESVETNSIPVRAVPAGAPAPIPQKREAAEIESSWGPATDTLQPTVENGRVMSLAESEKKLRSLTDLPRADEVSTSATGDPLFTKEVDDGLQQLLLEWSLFKKSGLFGTGAKGSEHPLFKKIAGLQIPLLLAGRFEGATQEVKQSITDYMNGWRYEQGIIYEQGETFEHYLRRVIRHILDLQKKRQNP